MPEPKTSIIGRLLRGTWWLLDGTRRLVFNLLFLVLLVALVWLLLKPGPAALEEKTTLVLDLSGALVEQRSGSPRDSALGQLTGDSPQQVQLRDVLAALDSAAKDVHITQAILALDDFEGAGLASLREVAGAIQRFKAAGKPVYAWGSNYSQSAYFLAAHANEVWLHPMGGVLVQGYGRQRNYYKGLFDKVGITANVIKAGTYKSFAEVFSETGPSPAATEAEAFLYDAIWGSWLKSVETARKLPPGQIAQDIEALPERLQAVGGDYAKLLVSMKLVDALKTRDEMRALMIERGTADEDSNKENKAGQTFRQVSLDGYLARLKPKTGGDAIGVIVAEGEISDGMSPPGAIGGRSTAELVKRAREDKNIKAVVLRVDSPGGSAFGSELVRHELELTRAAGKPVVVSMGDLAASGGYWISMAADEIIADEATITGSIGVVGMIPTAKAALDKVGVAAGGYSTTWLGTAFDPRLDPDPRLLRLMQTAIDHFYRQFLGTVAEGRKTTPEKIDAVAQGRVWTGAQALERGLVDRVGSYTDALQSATTRAKLPADVRVQYIEREPGRLQQLMRQFNSHVLAAVGLDPAARAQMAGAALGLSTGLPAATAQTVLRDLGWLAEVAERRQPYAAVVHCLCEAP